MYILCVFQIYLLKLYTCRVFKMLLDDKWIVRIHVQGQTGHMYEEKVTSAEEYREKKIKKDLSF